MRYPEGTALAEGPRPLRNVIGLDQADPGRAVFALDDGGVGAGREMRENRRLPVVGRREPGRADDSSLALAPVVVEGEESAVAVAQLQRRILQRAADARSRLTTARARGK